MAEEEGACPLCLEALEPDDLVFFPCKCGYQICRFCWTRIRKEENGLCPACREVYSDDPVMDLNSLPNGGTRSKKKLKDQSKAKPMSEMMKLLPELRVVQPNLIFVIGLPLWLGKDKEQLRTSEYFGKYGKVYKVEINQNQTFGGPQGQSSISAYITYHRSEDAMRAISELDQSAIHGRQLRVSLGTTKYCSQFLRGAKCTKHECMYLHELGDQNASFTKEQMQAGKHTEYMNKLLRDYAESVGDNNSATSGNSNRDSTNFSTSKAINGSIGNRQISSDDAAAEFRISSRSKDSFSFSSSQSKSGKATGDKQSMNNKPALQQKSRTNNQHLQSQAIIRNRINQSSLGTGKSLNTQSSCSSSNAGDNQYPGLPNNANLPGEDSVDIDFDPFSVSQDGLAELLAAENQGKHNRNPPTVSQHSHESISEGVTDTQVNPISLTGWSSNRSSENQQSRIIESSSTPVIPPNIPPPPGFEEKQQQQINNNAVAQHSSSTHNSYSMSNSSGLFPPGLIQSQLSTPQIPSNAQQSGHGSNSRTSHTSQPSTMSGFTLEPGDEQKLANAFTIACAAFTMALQGNSASTPNSDNSTNCASLNNGGLNNLTSLPFDLNTLFTQLCAATNTNVNKLFGPGFKISNLLSSCMAQSENVPPSATSNNSLNHFLQSDPRQQQYAQQCNCNGLPGSTKNVDVSISAKIH